MTSEQREILGGQFQWHTKPSGFAGSPCPVCGCPAKRLKAQHRALTADEGWRQQAFWEKNVSVCFGTMHAREAIRCDADGNRL